MRMRLSMLCTFCTGGLSALSLCSCLSWFAAAPPAERPQPAPLVIESTAPGLKDPWAAPDEPQPHIPEAGSAETPAGKLVGERALDGENKSRPVLSRTRSRLARRAPLSVQTRKPAQANPPAPRRKEREARYWKIVEQELRKAWNASPEAAEIRRLSRQRTVGRAGLVLHLTPDGTVAAAAIQKSSGSPETDRALLRAARSLKKLPSPPAGAGPVHLDFAF